MRAQRQKVRELENGGADPEDITVAKARYQGQLQEYKRFCNDMNLTPQMERVYIDGLGRIITPTKINKLNSQLNYVYNGEKNFIPAKAIMTDVKIIAGEGSKKILRECSRLSNQYGGDKLQWSKVVGKIESEKYIFDVHWYEYKGNGKQYEIKLKNRSEKE